MGATLLQLLLLTVNFNTVNVNIALDYCYSLVMLKTLLQQWLLYKCVFQLCDVSLHLFSIDDVEFFVVQLISSMMAVVVLAN